MPAPIAKIESLDLEGRGVAHRNGKVIFIEDALPFETVQFSSYKKKENYEFANVEQHIHTTFMREVPRCAYFDICGGCSMQHLEMRGQIAAKQRVLEDTLWHIGRLRPGQILPPIYGSPWQYRYRARLAARLVEKKASVLIGFHEKHSSFIADMHSCEILPSRISKLIAPLRKTLYQLSIRTSIPQIELAVGEKADVLVLRILEPLNEDDEILLKNFADTFSVQLWFQPKGPESAHPFYPLDNPALYYSLPEFDIKIFFSPTDFTQVNPEVNRMLVRRAIALLEPQPNERIADMFCGLGNFTLPIAHYAREVIGVEVSQNLVQRARENAVVNGLAHKAKFITEDLFEVTSHLLAQLKDCDKMLIDPPREGAIELLKTFDESGPKRIVYVSCNPATLARDASILVHKGYDLESVGIINMFPHTSHVESIALFEYK